MYLLDTDVISRTSPLSAGAGPGFAGWISSLDDRCYLSVITLAEIQAGLTRLLQRGAENRAARLAGWLEIVTEAFADRLLALDAPVARRTGELLQHARAAGHHPDFEDTCIAATADVHGFTVVTFNVRHFAPLGVRHRMPGP